MRRAVEIAGLESLRRGLAGLGAMKGLQAALRAEAEAVAAAAKATLTARDPASNLARSIKIMDLGQKDKPAFAVGTEEPAGHFLEFGTTRIPAFPWLRPALHAQSSSVNHTLRKVIATALKARSKD